MKLTLSTETPKLRVMGAMLAAAAAQLPDIETLPAMEPAEFHFGSFIVRCAPTRNAAQVVAAKLAKGFRRHNAADKLSRPTLRRPADAEARLAALLAECGAVELAEAA